MIRCTSRSDYQRATVTLAVTILRRLCIRMVTK